MILRLPILWLAMLLLLAGCATPGTPPPDARRISITFDDAPRTPGAFLSVDRRGSRLIAALASAGVDQAAFFVNPANLSEPWGAGGEGRLAAYVRAGHVLANHSFSHPRLSTTPAETYVADIDRAAAWLAGRAGTRPWFRFPFLDEGREDKAKRDAVRRALADRRLVNGYVTADGADWHLEALTVAAAAAGRAMDRAALRDLYVDTHVEAVRFNDRLARAALGRAPAQVLLLHETDLAALFLPDLIAALRADGWTIVTADAAFADPVAPQAASIDVASANGTLTAALAERAGIDGPRGPPFIAPAALDRAFAERVLRTDAGVGIAAPSR